MRFGLAGKIGQTWKSFLKAKDSTEKAKRQLTYISVSLLSHPQQLGKGGGKLNKTARRLAWGGWLSRSLIDGQGDAVARHFLRGTINDTPQTWY